MRLSQVAPYAAFVLIGQAALDSVPGVVAAREGGMGLGSALIAAQLTQVAGIALGAVLAAYLVERWSTHVALVVGALAVYAGLVGVGHQPMHSLVWVIAVHGVGGAGLGAVLTSSFSAAAGLDAAVRPFAVALLLLASLLARDLVAAVYLPGAATLAAAGALVVGGAAWLARRPAAMTASGGRDGATDADAARMTGRTALVGALLLSIGVVATLSGADPSGVSGTLVARFLGVTALDALGGVRAGVAIFGVVVLASGAALLVARRGASREVAVAAAAMTAAAFAAAGTLALIRFGASSGALFASAGPVSFGGATALGGGIGGLLIGAWRLSRGTSVRLIAAAGSALLGLGTVIAVADVVGQPDGVGSGPALVAVAVSALGGGLVASALRLVLAEVPPGERGFAAAAGVVGASFGAMAGLLVGAGEGMRLMPAVWPGIPTGFVLFLGAVLVALCASAFLPYRRADATGG